MMEQRCMWTADLETKVHTKVRNHGDGSYYGLLLVESGYYRLVSIVSQSLCIRNPISCLLIVS